MGQTSQAIWQGLERCQALKNAKNPSLVLIISETKQKLLLAVVYVKQVDGKVQFKFARTTRFLEMPLSS